MRLITLALCSTLALSLAACGNDVPVTDDHPASGITGVITAGPQCAVVVQGSPCPDAPWQGTVRVTTPEGDLVGEVDTDGRGRFRMPLDPGDYEVVAVTEPSRPPLSAPEALTVFQGEWIEVTLTVDTGIR
jgi:hypothetical protein